MAVAVAVAVAVTVAVVAAAAAVVAVAEVGGVSPVRAVPSRETDVMTDNRCYVLQMSRSGGMLCRPTRSRRHRHAPRHRRGRWKSASWSRTAAGHHRATNRPPCWREGREGGREGGRERARHAARMRSKEEGWRRDTAREKRNTAEGWNVHSH